MTRTPAPIVGRIPGEIHAHAQRLGFVVETYTETMAGHGTTGRVSWAVSHIATSGEFTDAVRMRYGSDSSHEHARASLRDALQGLEALQKDEDGKARVVLPPRNA